MSVGHWRNCSATVATKLLVSKEVLEREDQEPARLTDARPRRRRHLRAGGLSGGDIAEHGGLPLVGQPHTVRDAADHDPPGPPPRHRLRSDRAGWNDDGAPSGAVQRLAV